MKRRLHPAESSAATIAASEAGAADWPNYRTFQEWIAGGYLWREKTCDREGCGLPVLEFYLPGDFPFRVDPATYGPHADVCGDKKRVAAMRRAGEQQETPGLDWKRRASGER